MFTLNLKGTLKSGAYSEVKSVLKIQTPLLIESRNQTEIELFQKKIAKMEPTLTAKITKIDTFGVVTIKFTKYLKSIDPIDKITKSKALNMIIEPKTGEQK